MTKKTCRPPKKPPKTVWVTVEERDSLGHLRNVYYWTGSALAPRGHGAISYRYKLHTRTATVRASVREADVARMTKLLMRRFEGRHHRFLIDYGWEDVARCMLGARKKRAS